LWDKNEAIAKKSAVEQSRGSRASDQLTALNKGEVDTRLGHVSTLRALAIPSRQISIACHPLLGLCSPNDNVLQRRWPLDSQDTHATCARPSQIRLDVRVIVGWLEQSLLRPWELSASPCRCQVKLQWAQHPRSDHSW
jgi:hypothetical protein